MEISDFISQILIEIIVTPLWFKNSLCLLLYFANIVNLLLHMHVPRTSINVLSIVCQTCARLLFRGNPAPDATGSGGGVDGITTPPREHSDDYEGEDSTTVSAAERVVLMKQKAMDAIKVTAKSRASTPEGNTSPSADADSSTPEGNASPSANAGSGTPKGNTSNDTGGGNSEANTTTGEAEPVADAAVIEQAPTPASPSPAVTSSAAVTASPATAISPGPSSAGSMDGTGPSDKDILNDLTPAVQSKVEKAEKKLSGADYAGAGDLFEEAANLVDNDASLAKVRALLLVKRAACVLHDGGARAATETCKLALEADPACARALLVQGQALFQREKLKDAFSSYQDCILLGTHEHVSAAKVGLQEVIRMLNQEGSSSWVRQNRKV
eukprot:m.47350 g.47350  ORF g.47350 m.47350 type:complete len:384 (+) comp15214_c0_seq3:874-2025(+)